MDQESVVKGHDQGSLVRGQVTGQRSRVTGSGQDSLVRGLGALVKGHWTESRVFGRKNNELLK